jgi:phosphatidate cytidylyltransferase
MLRWRLLLGTLIIAALVGLCWLDHRAADGLKGVWLAPLLLLLAILASQEILDLEAANGLSPIPWVVYAGNLMVLFSPWVPFLHRRWLGAAAPDPSLPGHWPALAMALAVILAFAGEIRRYQRPGGVTANTAAATFAVAYVGLLLSFAVDLRLRWGVGALASLLIVVKAGDTGAYAVGRLLGRHKMAPTLSPAKTLEGACGAVVFALAGSWASFRWIVPLARETPLGDQALPAPWWGWIAFGILVGGTGMLGDLAESLIKRDADRKDSSRWMPGFGGVLDVLDSILMASPVAYLVWLLGWVG